MSYWSDTLRAELCARAARYAAEEGLESYQSLGTPGVTLFPPGGGGGHGNFIAESYAAIMGDAEWKGRLEKPHTRRKTALREPYNTSACELDSCTSSDALLMNIACYPGAIAGGIATLLGVTRPAKPAFGVPGSVPLCNGRLDSTELDMQLGATNVEAKLTEEDFTQRPIQHVERYANLYEVFERDALPCAGGEYLSYQLIRNVLAVATRPEAKLRVLLDSRRPDLLHEWWTLHAAIRSAELRQRCGFVLWQELATAAPTKLRDFLGRKYGL
jgi:hypothetical protein